MFFNEESGQTLKSPSFVSMIYKINIVDRIIVMLSSEAIET
jgi:hypothetical protein